MAPNTPMHQQVTSGGHHPREQVTHTGHGHLTLVNQHAVQALELTRFLKQHFKVPTAQPYKAQKLIRRTSRTCVGQHNKEKWRQNFKRRQSHLNDGFFTSQCEPYHPIGDIELDSKHMVLHVLANCLPKKLPLPGIGFGGHRVTVSPFKDVDGETRQKSLSPSGDKGGELDETDLATAGYTFIKDYLKDTKELLVAGKGGQPFEKNVKDIEERKRQLAENADTTQNAITFLPPEVSHRDVTLPLSSHYQQRERSSSAMSTESMKSTASTASRTKPVDSDVEVERMRLAFNRNRRAIIQKLDAIHKIMNALHNIKTRDLRTRVPLSHEAVRFMYREVPVSDRMGLSRPLGAATAAGTALSRPIAPMDNIQSNTQFTGSGETSSAGMHGGAKQLGIAGHLGRLTSRSHLTHSRPSAHVRPQDAGHSPTPPMAWKKFSRGGGLMSKIKAQHPEKDPKLIETWEDLLAVQTSSQGTGQHRLSVNPDKSQGYGMKWMNIHHRHHDPPQPPASKQPYWLTVSLSGTDKAKRPTPVSADGMTKDESEPKQTLQTIKDNFAKSQRKLAREIMTDLERLERERCRTFRQKFYSCDTSPLLEKTVKHMRGVAHIMKLHNVDDHMDIEVKPSKWYTDLKSEAENTVGKDDPEVVDILHKLSRFYLEDSRSIPNAKEKLCLLMMSMPASQLLTIPTQQALQFVMDNIILAPPEYFTQWLQHRKIPQIIPCSQI